MKGLRFVVFNETNKEDVQLSEALIKMTTDSGEIVARHPAGRPFSFQPTFTPVFCVNHLPQASMDPALWRRLLIVPFEYSFKGSEKDPSFPQKLLKEEAEGILAWVVDGGRMYLEQGLSPPDTLKNAVEGFKSELDVLGEFISDNYFEVDGSKIKLNDIRAGYIDYAKENGFKREPSALTFRRDMEDRGFLVQKGTGGYWFVHGLSTSAAVGVNKDSTGSSMLDLDELKNKIGKK